MNKPSASVSGSTAWAPEPVMEDTLDRVLDLASKHGAQAAQAVMGSEEGLTVNVRMGTVDQMVFHKERSLQLVVYIGQRRGEASTSDWDPDRLPALVEAACAIARYTEDDPAFGLPDEADWATDIQDLSTWEPWEGLDPQRAIQQARDAEAAGLDSDRRVSNSEGFEIHTQSNRLAMANSMGFKGHARGTRHSQQAVLVAQDPSGMQRDGWYTASRSPRGLESGTDVALQAAKRALARLGPRPVRTQTLPVVFAPDVAVGLLGHWVAACSGGKIYRKASFLCDALNTPIFPSWVRIDEHPHALGQWGSAAWDAEGVRTRAQAFVNEGVLQQYILSTYTARRLNLRTTGNAGGVHNLMLHANAGDVTELCAGVSKGVLITDMMGQGINWITGDYSRGASGFWIEHGQIQHPVEGITVAGNLKTMFQRLEAVGSDVDRRGSMWTGSWLIPDLTVASAPDP